MGQTSNLDVDRNIRLVEVGLLAASTTTREVTV